MFATVWQILNMKFMQWPKTEIIWICWNLLEKTREITSSRLIYLRCLILQATVGDGFQELAGSNQAFGMTHSYSAGPKKKKFVKLIDYTYACNSLTNFEYIEGACNDRKRKFDQIKLSGWLCWALKKESWFFNALSVKWNSWKIDKVVLFFISNWRCGFITV